MAHKLQFRKHHQGIQLCLLNWIEVAILENWVKEGLRKRQMLDLGEWAQNMEIFILSTNAKEKLSTAEQVQATKPTDGFTR